MKRPPLPEASKRAALYLNMQRHAGKLICAESGAELTVGDIMNGRIQFDHNPPLALRRRDPDGLYPPHDAPHFIDVVSVEGHAYRTNVARGLQRGDQTAVAHSRKVRRSCGLDPPKPKKGRKLQSRGFPTKEAAAMLRARFKPRQGE